MTQWTFLPFERQKLKPGMWEMGGGVEGTEDLEDVGCPRSPDQGRVMGEEHCRVGSGDSTCSPDSSVLPTLLSLEDVETEVTYVSSPRAKRGEVERTQIIPLASTALTA